MERRSFFELMSMLAVFERKLGIQQDRNTNTRRGIPELGEEDEIMPSGLSMVKNPNGVTLQLGTQLKVDLNFRL